MRIGVYLGQFMPPTEGGGSVFQHEVLSELSKQNKDFELYIYYLGEKQFSSENENIKYIPLRNNLLKKYFLSIKDIFYLYFYGFKKNYSFLNKIVLKDEINLMYYLSPSEFEETEIPYIFTMWDLGDKIHPYLPETSMSNRSFELRNYYYSKILPKALFTFIGNETGKKQLEKHYLIEPERIIKNPMITPGYIFLLKEDNSVLQKFDLEKEKFFFYPAQFWAHKNHIRLVYAMKELAKKGYKLVLTGSDKGNCKYIKSKIKELSLEKSVVITGFISQNEIISLYKNAFALIYASSMGPDNIPPLEAMGLGCLVVCAKYDGAEEQLGDSALFFNPYEEKEIVDAINNLEKDNILKAKLIANGKKIAEKYSIENYVKTVFDTFYKAEKIIEEWNFYKSSSCNNVYNGGGYNSVVYFYSSSCAFAA